MAGYGFKFTKKGKSLWETNTQLNISVYFYLMPVLCLYFTLMLIGIRLLKHLNACNHFDFFLFIFSNLTLTNEYLLVFNQNINTSFKKLNSPIFQYFFCINYFINHYLHYLQCQQNIPQHLRPPLVFLLWRLK